MSEPVFVELGPRLAERTQMFRPGARRNYPPEVQARLEVDAKEILGRYPQPRSALLPLLHLVQAEDGYITPAGIDFCAHLVDLTGAETLAVASFYSMYRREETGRYLVGVCTNTLCAVMGGDAILDALSRQLGIKPGETTADGAVTLEHVECNAACDYAPVVMVNWEFFDDQTVESALALVAELRAGASVTPTRGEPLHSFRDTARTLAGLPDPRQSSGDGSAPGAASLAGLEISRNHDTLLTPVLSANWDEEKSWDIENYRSHDGYRGLMQALDMHPDQVIDLVKEAGLRGRGGAGFPTGLKWSFIPQIGSAPHYLVVNADESEPGTCKDMPLMFANPHALVEGAIIASYAIRARHAFIYLRGEVVPVLRRVRAAVAQAYEARYLGRDILGSGFDLDLVVHAGAGAYICGEETALLDSLEGRRGQPRLRPPFPAVAGLYASPTVVNNVESIASVPSILHRGADWFRSMGTEKSPGFTLYSLSGHVTTPGQYEAPLGITLRQLLGYAGGIRDGRTLKFWTPGGSSTPMFTAEHLGVPLDYEGVAAAGSMLGTKALQIFDNTTCVVRAVLRWTEFYAHESCGKCTPCREGTYWLVQILRRLEAGGGTEEDLTKLLDVSDAVLGKSFCALGDGAASPIMSSLQYFRDEYLAHLAGRGCPFDPDDARLDLRTSREQQR